MALRWAPIRDAGDLRARVIPSLVMALLAPLCGQVPAGVIHLTGGAIDTSATPSIEERSPQRASAGAQGQVLALVQFRGPIQPQWLSACEEVGAEICHYNPEFAYTVVATPQVAAKLSGLDGIQWVGLIPSALKIHPDVRDRALGSGDLRVTILSVGELPLGELRRRGIQVERSRQTQMGWHDTRAIVPASEVEALAEWWNVFHVEPQPVYQRHGERAAQTAAGNYPPGGDEPAGPGYLAWLTSHGLSGGEGLTVQVQDDGLDQGLVTNEPGTAHPDLLGRLAGVFNATADPLGDSADGHGQINAGIITGNASVGTADAEGFLLGQGIAPSARVYGTKIFRNSLPDERGDFDIGDRTFTDLAIAAQDAGVTFSNNSWGASAFGAYTADAAEFDALVRDADPTEFRHQPMVYLFSAGNDGPLGGTLGAPATAKNVIAVGAGENSDASDVDGCGLGPLQADSLRDLTTFTSRGPTQDGRIGVTLVSVGTHVTGPTSTHASYSGAGVCGASTNDFAFPPDDSYFPPGQSDYTWSSGTSHSCPVATGAAMLVHDHFSTQLAPFGHSSDPSPALIKAVLINTATDMGGGGDGLGGVLAPIPNAFQGWGAVNLSPLVDIGRADLFSVDQAHVFTASGQAWEHEIVVSDPAKPLRVTLVWTDPPGVPGSGPVLVNDLDLSVTDGVETYRGNVFSGGVSVAGGTADRLNNVEAIHLPTPAGKYQIRVEAFNIAGDALPGMGGSLEQDFALFVWNGSGLSSQGTIEVDRVAVGCEDILTITVQDRDLRGAGFAEISAVTSSGDSVLLSLSETALASGIFTGALMTTTAADVGENVIQVEAGDLLTLTYSDDAAGDDLPADVSTSVPVDCTPPGISSVRVIDEGLDRFTVTFDTDEPAMPVVHAGQGCGVQPFVGQGPLAAGHSIPISGLSACTTYHFRVEVVDQAGNVAVDDNGGECHTATTFMSELQFLDDFESGAPGWTTTGLWHLVDDTSGFPEANSPVHSWWYGSEATGDYDVPAGVANSGRLISPLITLPPGNESSLTFHSWENTEPSDEFDTMTVLVETDGELTPIHQTKLNSRAWEEIGPLDLSLFSGETIRVVFEFDTVDGDFNGQRGWYVDDVLISSAVRCITPFGEVLIDGEAFPCGGVIPIQVFDRNAPASTVSVVVSTGGGDLETMQLTENMDDDIHRGEISVGLAGEGIENGDGRLQGFPFDTVTVLYQDVDVGDGTAAMLIDFALIDCVEPVISDLRVTDLAPDHFSVALETDEPATVTLRAGLSCDALPVGAVGDPGFSHRVTISQLPTCTTHLFVAEATDRAGNVAVQDNGGRCHKVTTFDVVTTFFDDFESGSEPGWMSVGLAGPNLWGLRTSPLAFSPRTVYSYQPGPATVADARLVAPDFSGGHRLRFRHSFETEAGFDGAVLEASANGGETWLDLGPFILQGGYSGSISELFGSPIAGRQAWTGGTLASMEEVEVDVSLFSESLLVGFRFASDVLVGSQGWLIDNVELLSFEPCTTNSDPIAVDDLFAVVPGSPLTVDVLANDSDPEGDPLMVAGAAQAESGTITVNPDNSVTYVPDPGFRGGDAFFYTARDGRGGADTGRVRLVVADQSALGDLLDFILGRADDPTGLDFNSDRMVDSADLTQLLIVTAPTTAGQ